MNKLSATQYRVLGQGEHSTVLEKSRIIAVFVEVEGAYGLMIRNSRMTAEEREALLQAARDSPVSD